MVLGRANVPQRKDKRYHARQRDSQQFQPHKMAAIAQAIEDASERAHDEQQTAEDEHRPVGRAPCGQRQHGRDDPGAIEMDTPHREEGSNVMACIVPPLPT